MTNAEAVEELRYQKKMSCMGVNYQANEEVIDMAISALERKMWKEPISVETNIYDTEEIHHNCTVQVLRNSVTGDVSVGWWREKEG